MNRIVTNCLLFAFFFVNQIAAAQDQTELFAFQMIAEALNDSEVAKELGILDNQKAELGVLVREFATSSMKAASDGNERVSEAMEKLKTNPNDEDAKKVITDYQSSMTDEAKKFVENTKKILLPHQTDRLMQLARQKYGSLTSKFRDEFGAVVTLASKIDLTKEESAALEKATVEARKEYYEEVRKLKEKAHQKILASIPQAKRDKLKELIGDRFDSAGADIREPRLPKP